MFSLFGPDARGNIWIHSVSPDFPGEGGYTVFNVAGTPSELSDDNVVRWDFDDASFLGTKSAIMDPDDGLWIGGYLFRYGDSLIDKGDAVWWQIDAYTPHSMVIDNRGARWFGYHYSGSHGALRYLDDNNTLEVSDDDAWTGFMFDNRVSFYNVEYLAVNGLNEKWVAGRSGRSSSDIPHLCSLDDGEPRQRNQTTPGPVTTPRTACRIRPSPQCLSNRIPAPGSGRQEDFTTVVYNAILTAQ